MTNSFEQISDPKHAYPRGDKLMKRLFKRFDHHAAYSWFEHVAVVAIFLWFLQFVETSL